jgi:hypothetical protein
MAEAAYPEEVADLVGDLTIGAIDLFITRCRTEDAFLGRHVCMLCLLGKGEIVDGYDGSNVVVIE